MKLKTKISLGMLVLAGGALGVMIVQTFRPSEIQKTEWEQDGFCSADSDCVEVDVSCEVCECEGEAVNREFEEKYRTWYQAACLPLPEEKCHLDCERTEIKCLENQCRIVPYGSTNF